MEKLLLLFWREKKKTAILVTQTKNPCDGNEIVKIILCVKHK